MDQSLDEGDGLGVRRRGETRIVIDDIDGDGGLRKALTLERGKDRGVIPEAVTRIRIGSSSTRLRISKSTIQRSGTMLSAVPPSIRPT